MADWSYLEEHIKDDEIEFDLTGENKEVIVLSDYRFTERAQRRIIEHELEIHEVSEALTNGEFDTTHTTGSEIVIGRSNSATILVVIRSISDAELKERASFDVVTAYDI